MTTIKPLHIKVQRNVAILLKIIAFFGFLYFMFLVWDNLETGYIERARNVLSLEDNPFRFYLNVLKKFTFAVFFFYLSVYGIGIKRN